MSYDDLPHLRSNAFSTAQAFKPTVAAGSGVTAHLTAGNDECGTVSVTITTPAVGVLATVTFATPYAAVPNAVVITPGDAHSATAELFATVSTTELTISCASDTDLAAADVLTLYYTVVGGF